MTITSPPVAPPSHASLTVPQGAALSIGAVLGTGVISLPALAADLAGPASLLAWLALVLLSVPLAATFAALGARYPDGGGVSTYARRAFGRRAAAVVGWCFYFAVPVGAPAAAMFAGHYIADVLGGGSRTALATAMVITLVVGVANFFGIRVSGRLQLVLASVLILLLVAATVAALPYADLGNLRPFAPHGWGAVGSAAALLVWAFAGWEAVSSLAADYRRPARDLPRATAVTVVVVGVLYLAIAATSILVLGSAAGSSAAPLSDLLALGIGGPVREITAVVAVLLTIGAMNAYFAGAAKLGAALGRDGALPAWFASGSAAGEIPRRSLLVFGGLALVALAAYGVLDLDVEVSVLVTTGSFSLVYVLGCAAAVRLLPRGTWARRSAVVALVATTGLLVLTGVYVVWALAVAAAALAYDAYANRGRRT
ncbi:MAG TPA: amino acid permease [Propionibacteriaceae bacterium]|nr:amino acid permease [Propionibacteriaceae bacterium]